MTERDLIDNCTLLSLKNFNIDPLHTVIGFFSVVGGSQHTNSIKARNHMLIEDTKMGSFETEIQKTAQKKTILRLS